MDGTIQEMLEAELDEHLGCNRQPHPNVAFCF